jgi:hypothetical protein
MEAVAPGTGIASGLLVQQNEGFFQSLGNSFSNFFSGSGSDSGSGKVVAGTGSANFASDTTKYYIIAGVVILVVVIAVIVMRRKKQ